MVGGAAPRAQQHFLAIRFADASSAHFDASCPAEFEADAKAKVEELSALLSEREEEFYSYQNSAPPDDDDYDDEDDDADSATKKPKPPVDSIDYADDEEEEDDKDEM